MARRVHRAVIEITFLIITWCYNAAMNIKERPNHLLYIRTLSRMSSEARLLKAFELTEFSKQLFLHGLRKRFPDLNKGELHNLFLERLRKCHNRNY
jgi:hypothetical protein